MDPLCLKIAFMPKLNFNIYAKICMLWFYGRDLCIKYTKFAKKNLLFVKRLNFFYKINLNNGL